MDKEKEQDVIAYIFRASPFQHDTTHFSLEVLETYGVIETYGTSESPTVTLDDTVLFVGPPDEHGNIVPERCGKITGLR